MSENDKNEQPIEAAGETMPAGPAAEAAGRPPAGPAPEPASGSGPDETVTDAGHGWRPSATEESSATAEPPATPPADAPAPSVDAPTGEQPYAAGTPWAPPAPTYTPGTANPYPPAPQPGTFPTAQYPSYPSYPGAPTPSGGYPGAPTSSGGYPGAPTSSGGYPGSGGPGYGTNYAPAGGYQSAAGYQPPQPGAGRRRGGKAIAGLLAAGLVVALAGGAGGAAIMHAMDNDTTTAAAGPGSSPDNAPIVDRSSLASIAAAVSPSVVSITTPNAEGSGVILSKDGYVLTNNHVAATANGGGVTVTFGDGTATKASLVGTDARTDLAVYKASKVSPKANVAKFGDSNSLRVGDTVLAIGSPLGLDGSVTAGIVSALNRTIDESSDSPPQDPFGQQNQSNNSPSPTIAGAIQTDAAINPGNSGGALVNMNGEVVGINTAIATNGADGNIGVGFAIPSNRAKTVFEDIVAGKPVSHPYIGIEVSTADGNAGAQVKTVQPNSPAASAGLKPGDLITEYSGQVVHTSDDLINYVQAGTANTSVALTVVRGGVTQTINVTLGEQK